MAPSSLATYQKKLDQNLSLLENHNFVSKKKPTNKSFFIGLSIFRMAPYSYSKTSHLKTVTLRGMQKWPSYRAGQYLSLLKKRSLIFC